MQNETKREIGKLFVDIGKYVITAVVVSSFFKSFDENTWTIYLIGGITAMTLIVAGFWSFDQSNKTTKNKA